MIQIRRSLHPYRLLVVFALMLISLLAVNWPGEIAPPPVAAESILGDVDGDGRVNSIDAFLLLQFSAGIIGIGSPYREKADVNHDQSVNAIDAVRILQFHAGLIQMPNGQG